MASSFSVHLAAATIFLMFIFALAQPSRSVLHSLTMQTNNIQSSTTEEGVGESSIQKKSIDCGAACRYRCSKASRTKICMRACGTCCQRCNCVPPGTYGNHYMCPCYAALTTHGGRRKCP